jgi:glycerol-3-phosphate cytidylyltransferase
MNCIFNNDTVEHIQQIKRLTQGKKVGFTCSCFDLLHSGHVLMLKDCKTKCDVLVVGLQTDPTLDRAEKNKPIQEFEERQIMVEGIKYVDYIIKYATEKDLTNILITLKPDIRILGSDWMNKSYTGKDLDILVYFHIRNHDYSTSNLRKRIYDAEDHKKICITKNDLG